MRRQGVRVTETGPALHTILLLGQDRENLIALAQWIGAPDRIVIATQSPEAVRAVLDRGEVGLAIVDIKDEVEGAGLLASLEIVLRDKMTV